MNNIKELLQGADPLRNEPAVSSQHRVAQRMAVLAAVSVAKRPEAVTPKSRVRLFAFLVAAVAVVVFVGERVWSPRILGVHAAVRFEMRLAENQPASGLREVKIAGKGRPIYLHAEVIESNADIAAAHVVRDGNFYKVSIEFKAAGAKRMREATAKHLGRPIAFLIDGRVIMAPAVAGTIDDYAEIDGNFTKGEADRIVKGIIGN
jgi:hypothetical protein